MAFTNVWDNTIPADSQLASLGAQDFRNFRVDVQQRMAAISGLYSAIPDFGSDTTPANWTGILFFATDTGHIYQWSGTAWVDVTASFITTPVSPLVFKYSNVSAAGSNTLGVTIPAASLQSGTIIKFSMGGHTSGGPPGPNIRPRIASIATPANVIDLAGFTGNYTSVCIEATIIVSGTGASAVVYVDSFGFSVNTAYVQAVVNYAADGLAMNISSGITISNHNITATPAAVTSASALVVF